MVDELFSIKQVDVNEVTQHLFLLHPRRIQTGKLSEFLTTSCFAHLSFMDGGKQRQSLFGSDDEDDEVCIDEDAMHDLNFDGKEGTPGVGFTSCAKCCSLPSLILESYYNESKVE